VTPKTIADTPGSSDMSSVSDKTSASLVASVVLCRRFAQVARSALRIERVRLDTACIGMFDRVINEHQLSQCRSIRRSVIRRNVSVVGPVLIGHDRIAASTIHRGCGQRAALGR